MLVTFMLYVKSNQKLEGVKIDELEDLAQCLNQMTQQLQESLAIWKKANEEKQMTGTDQPASTLLTDIRTHDRKLRQLLMNLLNNFLKFTKVRGINFQVEVMADSRGNPLGLTPEDSLAFQLPIVKIRFKIEETGRELNLKKFKSRFLLIEQIGKIYQNSEDTGLGLAISQRISQIMGSTIQIKSKMGVSSRDWIDLDFLNSSLLVEFWSKELFASVPPTPTPAPIPFLSIVTLSSSKIKILYNLAMKSYLQGLLKNAKKLNRIDLK